MTRKGSTGGKIGVALLAVGLAATAWHSAMVQFSIESLGRIAIVVGVILICYGKLIRRTAASAETYRLGFDIGYERGCDDMRATRKPVVVDLESLRVEARRNATRVGDRV